MSIQARKKHDIIKLSGIGKFCFLNKPSKKFKPEFGEYICDTVVSEEVAEKVKAQLRPVYEQELKARTDLEGKELKKAELPFVESEDGTLIKTKLKGGHRTKEGKVYEFNVALFDASCNPLPKDVQVWGGSKVNVAVRPNFWYTASLGFGVTFEIQAVQVVELANGGVSSVAAEAFGLTSEEGYVANGGETLDQVFDAEETSEEEETVKANF
jgi:hypothetical protein